ncbi:uncharacterized protein LOC128547525 [Mercenaria mercenaria]|uniref:uncharacterized protein LOC128547525 n=1 Tax=Mercenaria mercenaria TaxID=6596 RepID=UPI00234E3997|nr:uncharacterized protein LOC128547525 [Mercenaria mercenaria]
MATAVSMVKQGLMSKRQAAKTYGVPRTNLLDKVAGRVPEERTSPGTKPVLTSAEETVLVDYLKLMASIGYPVSREELLLEVKKILDIDGHSNLFKNNKPGKDWFYSFKKRHPDVSERTAMNLGHQRAIVNLAMVEGWYAGLYEYLKSEVQDYENLVKDPRRIFNADESGFPLCFKTGKVLASKGASHVYNVTTSNKQQITVMVCFNVFDDYLPPLIVYPGQCFRDTGLADFPQAMYGHSVNGWMDGELFVAWLQQFESYVTEKQISKPVL